MRTVNFRRVFSAAHRVWNDPGKCSNIHGHNYVVEIKVEALDGSLNEQGFVVPFDLVKDVVDSFDHALIVHTDDPLLSQLRELGVELRVTSFVPSTENLAQFIAEAVQGQVPGPSAVLVSLRETEGIEATCAS